MQTWPKDKGKGKEAALKAKESELAKPQAVAQEKKAANPSIPLPVGKEDPPRPRLSLGYFFLSLYFFSFCCGSFPLFMMYFFLC